RFKILPCLVNLDLDAIMIDLIQIIVDYIGHAQKDPRVRGDFEGLPIQPEDAVSKLLLGPYGSEYTIRGGRTAFDDIQPGPGLNGARAKLLPVAQCGVEQGGEAWFNLRQRGGHEARRDMVDDQAAEREARRDRISETYSREQRLVNTEDIGDMVKV